MTDGGVDGDVDGGVIRVVVVEDQPDIADALRELVESDGAAVVVAVCHTLAIGTEMVVRFRPDLVLTDFRLPDGDAVECFGSWRAASPTVRIVVASAWTDDRSVRRAMAAGAAGYLEKGQGLMELSGVIARVCAGEHVWQASPPTGAVPVIGARTARPAERRASGHGSDGDRRHTRGREPAAPPTQPATARAGAAATPAPRGAARSGAVTGAGAPHAPVGGRTDGDTGSVPRDAAAASPSAPGSTERTGPARRHAAPPAPPAAPAPPAPHAADVLRGVLAGRSTDQIAADVGITATEVRRHVNVLLRAAGVRTRAALRGYHGAAT